MVSVSMSNTELGKAFYLKELSYVCMDSDIRHVAFSSLGVKSLGLKKS